MSSASTPASPARHLRLLIRKAWAAWSVTQRRRQQSAAARTLDALNDHVLKDMGISRGDLRWPGYRVSPDRAPEDR